MQNLSFYCLGCSQAYNIIQKLDLDKFYNLANDIYNFTPKKISPIHNDIDFKQYIYKKSAEICKIKLAIGGISCGACVWLIENTVKSFPNVLHASLNLNFNLLEITWQDQPQKISNIVNTILKLGYSVLPFTSCSFTQTDSLEQQKLLKRLAISGFAAAQVMGFTFAIWFGNYDGSMGEVLRYILHIISAMIAIPCTIYAAYYFFRPALLALRQRKTNMDVPISIAIIMTLIISIQETFLMSSYSYFDAATSLTFLLLVGRYINLKAKQAMQSSFSKIHQIYPEIAIVKRNGKLKRVNTKNLTKDELVIVAAGDKIPVDGHVISGASKINNYFITGETIPTNVIKNDYVHAGAINLEQNLTIKTDKVTEDTVVGQILALITKLGQHKSNYVLIADKFSKYFTPVILILAAINFLGWLLINGSITSAALNAVTLLIITCPCAIGLAVPMVEIIALGNLLNKSIYVQKGDALERLNEVDSIIFDKTGTLTFGQPKFTNHHDFTKKDKKILASMAAHSRHLLCQSITANLPNEAILNLHVTEKQGQGLKAQYHDDVYLLGSARWCKTKASPTKKQYMTIWFRKNNAPAKKLLFLDQLRPEADKIIRKLQQHYDVYILSGDIRENVEEIASRLNVKNFAATQTYEDKYKFLQKLHRRGKKTLMIGDGLNDAVALKYAHCSMSPKTGLSISKDAADFIYNGNLNYVFYILIQAQKSICTVKQNFIISLIYNVAVAPIAILGYANPVIAAIAMSFSSLTVIFNSWLLRQR